MQTKYNNRCNIGVGNFIQLDDKTFRENYIAIDDSTKSPQYKYNKYVSRAHAYISFDEERGFCLHVERGGTRNAQKRTHIYRNGETIELNNTLISEVLHDGDRIILSKSVHLLFKEL